MNLRDAGRLRDVDVDESRVYGRHYEAVDATRVAMLGISVGLVPVALAGLAMIRRPPWPDLHGEVSPAPRAHCCPAGSVRGHDPRPPRRAGPTTRTRPLCSHPRRDTVRVCRQAKEHVWTDR